MNTSNQRRAGLFCSVPTLRPERKTTLPIVGALHLRSTAHAVHPLHPVERSTLSTESAALAARCRFRGAVLCSSRRASRRTSPRFRVIFTRCDAGGEKLRRRENE